MQASNIGGLWSVEIYKSFTTESETFPPQSPRSQNDCNETRARAYRLSPDPNNIEEFVDQLTQRIFQKCQMRFESDSFLKEGNQFLLRAGKHFFTGSQEQIDKFFKLWEANPLKDASSVAQAPQITLNQLPKVETQRVLKEFTPQSLSVFRPGHPFPFSNLFRCCSKNVEVLEPHVPIQGDILSQISVTVEAIVSIDPENGKSILELRLNELTSALKKPRGCILQDYIVYQDSLSISLEPQSEGLNLIYRLPGDQIREVQHQYNQESETGIDANISVEPGKGGAGIGINHRNTQSHSVGLTVRDFEGYLKGTEGWEFKLKQVTNAKGNRVPYSGGCEVGILETLLESAKLSSRLTGTSKRLLKPPEQAMFTLKPPECIKKWQVNQSFKDEVTILAKVEQRIIYIDNKSFLDTAVCKFELPIHINFANFKITYDEASFDSKESRQHIPILARKKNNDALEDC